jgi:hypothetical protein
MSDPANLCYTDSLSHSSCYVDFGDDSWQNGNDRCQKLGGHLPTIFTADEYQFLSLHFQAEPWTSLSSDS